MFGFNWHWKFWCFSLCFCSILLSFCPPLQQLHCSLCTAPGLMLLITISKSVNTALEKEKEKKKNWRKGRDSAEYAGWSNRKLYLGKWPLPVFLPIKVGFRASVKPKCKTPPADINALWINTQCVALHKHAFSFDCLAPINSQLIKRIPFSINSYCCSEFRSTFLQKQQKQNQTCLYSTSTERLLVEKRKMNAFIWSFFSVFSEIKTGLV